MAREIPVRESYRSHLQLLRALSVYVGVGVGTYASLCLKAHAKASGCQPVSVSISYSVSVCICLMYGHVCDCLFVSPRALGYCSCGHYTTAYLECSNFPWASHDASPHRDSSVLASCQLDTYEAAFLVGPLSPASGLFPSCRKQQRSPHNRQNRQPRCDL